MAEADKNAYTPRMRKHYDEVVRQKLIEEFGYKNPMEVPQITKIVINMGVGASTAQSNKASVAAGDHARIASWRRSEAERITAERRPDLLPRKPRLVSDQR